MSSSPKKESSSIRQKKEEENCLNLAAPAPTVEAATATTAAQTQAAKAETAPTVAAPTATAAAAVEPATVGRQQLQEEVPKQQPQQQQQLSALSAAALRQSGNITWEGPVGVLHGKPDKNILQRLLPILYDERDFVAYSEIRKYIIMTADVCYIFHEPPSYSSVAHQQQQPYVCLVWADYTVQQEDPHQPSKYGVTVSPLPDTNLPRPGMVTVLLTRKQKKKKAHENHHQFTIDTTETGTAIPKLIMDTIRRAQSSAVAVAVVDDETAVEKKS